MFIYFGYYIQKLAELYFYGKPLGAGCRTNQ